MEEEGTGFKFSSLSLLLSSFSGMIDLKQFKHLATGKGKSGVDTLQYTTMKNVSSDDTVTRVVMQ